MRQVIPQKPTSDATVRVISSERLATVPDGVRLDHASCGSAVGDRHLAASSDGRFAAQVIRAGEDGFLIRHSHASLPDIPFKPEPGKGAPKILRVTEEGVIAWASRARQTGIFEIGDEGIFFRAELDLCDGWAAGSRPVAYGTHPGGDGIRRRRFVREGSWSVLDEPLFHDVVTNAWRPVESVLAVLPDGRLLCVRRTRKGYERLLVGDGDPERVALPHAASVRSHLLGTEPVDILNDGHTHRLLFRRACTVGNGSVERSWQSPDGSRLLFVASFSNGNDAEERTKGPMRSLVRMDADGSRRVIASGRICLEANAVSWAPDGRGYAAVVRKFESVDGPFVRYRDYLFAGMDGGIVLPAAPSTRITEAVVGRDGALKAHLREEHGATKAFVRGTDFGSYTFAWNLSHDAASGGVAFNAVVGNGIQRIVIS